MSDGVDRNKALEILRRHLTNDVLVKHCLATEAVMRTGFPKAAYPWS